MFAGFIKSIYYVKDYYVEATLDLVDFTVRPFSPGPTRGAQGGVLLDQLLREQQLLPGRLLRRNLLQHVPQLLHSLRRL